ncbi:MAG TPA: hypothetical protein VKY37_12025 [Brumimicrobium sp.]|nr:hypothetical protein [Brumimicrobium sp.]
MKKQIIYQFIAIIFLLIGCQNQEEIEIPEEKNPPFQAQLVNWSVMNKSGWKNMSFPVWFNPYFIDSLSVEHIEIEFTNFNYTDSIMNVSDTMPYRKVFIDFKSKGEVKKVVRKEMNAGVKIAEYIFSYKTPLDAMGYSPPAVSSNVKYREKSIISLFSTFQELQQYQRMVLIETDSTHISYLDKSSLEEVHHYFILDSAYWNVSFIDQEYTPQGKNIFYYGSPIDYTSSFTLINLVEKSLKEERVFYPTGAFRSQSFYENEFITKRYFDYDSLGLCLGFVDSLITTSGDFLHLEKGIIEYKNDLPKSLSFFNEEDSLMITPVKRMKLNYVYRP